jgi:hypothetical protein
MPLYEFKCPNEKCPDVVPSIEVILSSFESENPPCPYCGRELKRKPSAGTFQWGRGMK